MIVEDNYWQSQWITKVLKDHFSKAKIECIETELEFRSGFEVIVANKPDVVVMDIMLRWTNPSPNMTPPPLEIQNAGFYHAGFRCKTLLNQDETTKNIPILLYTVLGMEDLESELPIIQDNVIFLQKDGDTESLSDSIHSLISVTR